MTPLLTALLIATTPAPTMTTAQYLAVMHALVADPSAPCVVTAPLGVSRGVEQRYVVCVIQEPHADDPQP